jgi:hypothetical protein
MGDYDRPFAGERLQDLDLFYKLSAGFVLWVRRKSDQSSSHRGQLNGAGQTGGSELYN